MKEIVKLTEKKREQIKNWLKRNIGIDLFDLLNLFLFLLGTISIIYLKFIKILEWSALINSLLLFFTAIVVLQYTKETYWLKQTQQKQYDLSRTPYLRLQTESKHGNEILFAIINDGIGLARKIKIKNTVLSLRNIGEFHFGIKEIQVIAPGPNADSEIGSNEIIYELKNEIIVEALRDKYRDVDDFVINITYLDATGREFEAKFKFDINAKDNFREIYQRKID